MRIRVKMTVRDAVGLAMFVVGNVLVFRAAGAPDFGTGPYWVLLLGQTLTVCGALLGIRFVARDW